jgi:hypothetical protein
VEGLRPFAGLVELFLHAPGLGLREGKGIGKGDVVNDGGDFLLGLGVELGFSLHLGGCLLLLEQK